MKFYIISGIFLLLGLLTGVDPSCKSSPCIGIDVYYESLCRGSGNYIDIKLVPSYPAFKDHLDLTFIPYGKANHTRNETGKWVFTCQHGEKECQGNKAQACGLHAIEKILPPENKQEYSFNLIVCTMSIRFSSNHSISRCADRIGLSEEVQRNITNCIESSVGDDLLAAYGDKTHSIRSPLRVVPTIVINGVYSEQHQHAAFFTFERFICNLLTEGGKNLTYCASFNSTQ